MKFYIIFLSLALMVNAATDKDLWLEFKQIHEREYRSLREEQQRFSIFQSNLRVIEKHNELYAKREKPYHMGVNQFSDMTPEEFGSMLKQQNVMKPIDKQPIVWHNMSDVQPPESFNWLPQGVVTGIKNQKNCGSCWAFSTTGALEGAYALKTGQLVLFSEQNLVDCSKNGNAGCIGGVMQSAFDFVKDYGIEAETDYPYKAANGVCQFNPSLSITRIQGYVNVPQDETALLDAVVTIGPIPVGINANFFQNYAGGVFDEPGCTSDLDHEVLVIGYGNQDGFDFWLIKNSWGVYWGESGYIKLVRNKNQCGIATDIVYPVI